MIQQQTLVKIADNSSIKNAKCIKVLEKLKKASIGDMIIVSIQKIKDNSNNKLNKKMLVKAVVLTTKQFFNCKNGFFLKFKTNSIVILDAKKAPIATRIFGLVPRRLKKKFPKIIALSNYLI